MGHIHFLNSTCDIEESNRQRHATLRFLKIDMGHSGPPIKGPTLQPTAAAMMGLLMIGGSPMSHVSLNRLATLVFFKIDTTMKKIVTMDISYCPEAEGLRAIRGKRDSKTTGV